jgi:hypothetical protein
MTEVSPSSGDRSFAQYWERMMSAPETIERNSLHSDLVKNADGSVDLYVRPQAPAGLRTTGLPPLPAKAWFSYVRLYGPTEAHFNRTWILPEFEKVQ